MKHRVIQFAMVLVGICIATQMAHAGPEPGVPPPGAKAGNPDLLGPLGGDQWMAPVATVNPEVLISDDSSDPRCVELFDPHFKSSFGANAFPSSNSSQSGNSKFEAAKPIEKVEARSDDALSDQPIATVSARSSGTKRVVIIALASVALLAFRKFRRPKTGMPPKPSFL